MSATLAEPAELKLAHLVLRPRTCEVVDRLNTILLEPQIMRVFTVLAENNGHVVSRDRLVELCWGGRSISEDAINRVISRIRKLGSETDAFALQTQRKVGYRLVENGAAAVLRPAEAAVATNRAWIRWVVAAAVLVVVGVSLIWAMTRHAATDTPRSIAVRVTSAGSTGNDAARLLQANLRQSLARLHGLRVLDSPTAGSADLLLEGTVAGADTGSPVLLTLENASTRATIWTGRFGTSSVQVPQEQRAVAAAVRYLAVWLGDRLSAAPAAKQPEMPQVVQLVAEGSRAWQLGNDVRQQRDLSGAVRLYSEGFEKVDAALRLDPQSAKALILRYRMDDSPEYPRTGESAATFRDRMVHADEMLTRAVAADPDDPTVLVEAAQGLDRAMDWRDAGTLFRRALAISPNSADANSRYAFHLALLGQCRAGLKYAEKARSLDPTSVWSRLGVPRMLQCAGERTRALQIYQMILAENPANTSIAREAYLVALGGRDGQALRALARHIQSTLWKDSPPPAVRSMVERIEASAAAVNGDPARLLKMLAVDERSADDERRTTATRTPGDALFALAYEYAHAGAVDKALDALTRARDRNSVYLPWALPQGAAEFPEPLRSDPRYRALWRSSPEIADLLRMRAAARQAGG